MPTATREGWQRDGRRGPAIEIVSRRGLGAPGGNRPSGAGRRECRARTRFVEDPLAPGPPADLGIPGGTGRHPGGVRTAGGCDHGDLGRTPPTAPGAFRTAGSDPKVRLDRGGPSRDSRRGRSRLHGPSRTPWEPGPARSGEIRCRFRRPKRDSGAGVGGPTGLAGNPPSSSCFPVRSHRPPKPALVELRDAPIPLGYPGPDGRAPGRASALRRALRSGAAYGPPTFANSIDRRPTGARSARALRSTEPSGAGLVDAGDGEPFGPLCIRSGDDPPDRRGSSDRRGDGGSKSYPASHGRVSRQPRFPSESWILHAEPGRTGSRTGPMGGSTPGPRMECSAAALHLGLPVVSAGQPALVGFLRPLPHHRSIELSQSRRRPAGVG